jgi:hypothetical protein
MADPLQHPGSLSTMGKIWEGFKHVAGKALKWAAGVALVGGAIAALVLLPGSALVSLFSTGTGVALESGIIVKGLLFGGAIGGILGAVKGLGGMPDAIKEADAESITNYERGEARQARMSAMQMQSAKQELAMAREAQEIGGQSLPGRDQGMGRA